MKLIDWKAPPASWMNGGQVASEKDGFECTPREKDGPCPAHGPCLVHEPCPGNKTIIWAWHYDLWCNQERAKRMKTAMIPLSLVSGLVGWGLRWTLYG